jgi:ketosteroid isomerase-like protein
VAESENIAAVRRFADAFNRRDFDGVLAGVDPEVELYEWPDAPGARSYRGPDEVLLAIENWFDAWEWMDVVVEDTVEAGDRVLVTLHQRAKGKGSAIEVEIRTWNVYTFRDGKLLRMQLFTGREPALEAFGVTDEQIRKEAR